VVRRLAFARAGAAALTHRTIGTVVAIASLPSCNAVLGNTSHAIEQDGAPSADSGSSGPGNDSGADATTNDGALSDGTAPPTDARPSGDGPSSPGDAGPDASPCATVDDCPMGKNCAAGTCVNATVGCAAQKNSYPKSQDGTYWIAPAGVPELAFCDMTLQVELCTETAGEHVGRTREGSNLAFKMSSLLLYSQRICKIWAVRAADDTPFAALDLTVPNPPPLGTCAALGFASDATIGQCPYGTVAGTTTCGFPVNAAMLYQYGNVCPSCPDVGAGLFSDYVLQGRINSSTMISAFDGTTFTTCRIQ
jgi:hypothetical protein